MFFATLRGNILHDRKNSFITSLWSVSQAHRGLSSQRWATNLTSTQRPFIVFNKRIEGTNSPLGLWLESPSQAFFFLVLKLLFNLLKGLHESPEQVSHFLHQLLNSSLSFARPENMNHVTAAWLPPMWHASSPPHTALCYFLLCLHSLNKPHEHQCRSEGRSFNLKFQFLSTLSLLISLFNCMN